MVTVRAARRTLACREEVTVGWSSIGAVMTFAIPVGVFVAVCALAFFLRKRVR
jgi:hypothetical protein